MLTEREAYQRCYINRVSLERTIVTRWVKRMAFHEVNYTVRLYERSYTSDDLEDVVLMGGKMRREYDKAHG